MYSNTQTNHIMTTPLQPNYIIIMIQVGIVIIQVNYSPQPHYNLTTAPLHLHTISNATTPHPHYILGPQL